MRRPAALAFAALLAAAGAGCATTDQSSAGDEAVRVVAAFYPLQFAAERVGGDAVSVTGLAPPGVEAHDLELTPSQVAEVAEADLVIYLEEFQPPVDAAVAEHAGRALNVAEVVPLLAEDGHEHEDEGEHEDHEHGAADPHVWLDPDRMATIAEEIAEQLGAVDADNAGQYADRAAQLGEELAGLDSEYADGLADCERREFVVSHSAFGYLAERYDLTQISLAGLSPEDEPTPQRLADVAERAREHDVTTIFFEVLASPRVAEVLADHVDADTAVLDPIEGLASGGTEDYFSLMRANLDGLRDALGCT